MTPVKRPNKEERDHFSISIRLENLTKEITALTKSNIELIVTIKEGLKTTSKVDFLRYAIHKAVIVVALVLAYLGGAINTELVAKLFGN